MDGARFQAGLASEVASKSGADLKGVKCLFVQVPPGLLAMKKRAMQIRWDLQCRRRALCPLLRWTRIRKAPGAFEGSAFRTHGLPENRPLVAAKRPTFSPRLAASRLGRPANEQGHADVHALCLPVLQTRGSALMALSRTFSSGGKRLAQSSHAACAQAGMRWPTAMMVSFMWQKRRQKRQEK